MHDAVDVEMPVVLLPRSMRTRISEFRDEKISQLTDRDMTGKTPFCTERCGLKRAGNTFDAPVLMWHDLTGHERNAAAGITERGPDIEIDGLVILRERCEVYVDGIQVRLTDTEYRLLLFLVIQRGRLLDPGQIINAVWGVDWGNAGSVANTNMVRSNINRLRVKLCPGVDRSGMTYGQKRKGASNHRFIRTVFMFGYIFG